MKKVISIILILSIISGFSCLSYAAISYGVELKEDAYSSEVTFNEYLMVKQLLEKSDTELYKVGYSVEDVKELRNIDYEQIIYERYIEKYGTSNMSKNLSAKEFVNTLTIDQLSTLTASCTVSHKLDPRDYYYDSVTNKTNARITFSWSWNSEPIWKGIDIIGFGWDSQMYVDTSTSFVNVYYYSTFDGTRTKTEQHAFTQYITFNVSDKFTLWQDQYPKTGSGALRLYCTGKNQNLGVSYKYGHTYVGITAPSISVGSGVGISFTFTGNVTEYPSPIVTGHIN
ncbi:MAG: hypothetical protein K0R54_4544 [Clostridiaceae bacterium]|jgi:hypothetical protein|uniref:hypothetical protein n=1 Tax=Clostridium sp. TaxID=1506 RepID=UPI00258F6793|nr:hypothetical protein [Clostridium sp.]MDF2504994.1 hypothetical protein [Clostridium sp.]MDF2883979.1 hypothetical protein [Clostridiaceae bacterium]